MYGLLITLGIVISILLAEKIVKNKNLSIDTFWKIVFWGLVTSIIGARINFVIANINYFKINPEQIFFVWEGGMRIIGGLLFAGVTIYLIAKKDFLNWIDVFARVLPLGQTIGRWGNIFNNELMPFALYESILDFMLFLLINILATKKPKTGILSSAYLIGYSIIRYTLEPYRQDNWVINGISVTRLGLLFIVIGSIVLIWKINTRKKS